MLCLRSGLWTFSDEELKKMGALPNDSHAFIGRKELRVLSRNGWKLKQFDFKYFLIALFCSTTKIYSIYSFTTQYYSFAVLFLHFTSSFPFFEMLCLFVWRDDIHIVVPYFKSLKWWSSLRTFINYNSLDFLSKFRNSYQNRKLRKFINCNVLFTWM